MAVIETPMLRTSERKAFKKCPQQWQWRYREGLVPRMARPDARWFGTGIHLALAERYKYKGFRRGRNVIKVWRDYCGDEHGAVIRTVHDDEVEWLEARELGEAMLGGYLDTYGMDEQFYVISTEQPFEVPIMYNGKLLTYYDGTFDGVRLDETDETYWLWENKTAAQIRLQHLPLDDQAGGYFAVAPDVLRAMKIPLKGNLEGIQYDFMRKAMPDTRPRNAEGLATNKPTKADYIAAFGLARYDPLPLKTTLDEYERLAAERKITVLGDVSKTQPAANFHREPVSRTRRERRTQIERVRNEALWIKAIDTHRLPLVKNPSIDHCGYCDFKDLCELHEQGSDWKELKKLAFKYEDPYVDHRKNASDE